MEAQENREMIVVDVQMPFWSTVTFMVRWAIAAIPTIVILLLVVLAAVLGGMTSGMR